LKQNQKAVRQFILDERDFRKLEYACRAKSANQIQIRRDEEKIMGQRGNRDIRSREKKKPKKEKAAPAPPGKKYSEWTPSKPATPTAPTSGN